MRLTPEAKQYAYWVYRHLVPPPLFRLQEVEIYSDPSDARLADYFTSLLVSADPVFICRIGGNDEERAYFNDPTGFARRETYLPHMQRVQELRGYFDVDHEYSNFERFLQGHISAFKNADCLMYGNERLAAQFEHNVFLPSDAKLLDHVCRGKTLISYGFVESVMPFLASFKIWGRNKKILVVSPFSRSLEYQYQRRNELIVDYEFPEFELVTYSSPITWSAMDDTSETLGVSTRNWHQECERMSAEIAKLDFDVALLSCGAYAVYLGDFIRHRMRRKAVYLGGVLNVLFNIYGPRYDTPFFNWLMRPETQIDAFENDRVSSLRAGRSFANEAMRAYFGHRSRP